MTIPDEARSSRKAYFDWLTREIETCPYPGIRNSLQTWIGLCPETPPPQEVGDIRVMVGNAETDLGSRAFRLPQPKFDSRKTAVGWTVADTGIHAADLSGSTIFGDGIVVLEGRAYADRFRSSPLHWLEQGWYMPQPDIGFDDFDIASFSCLIRRSRIMKVRALDASNEYFLFNSSDGFRNFGHFLHDTMAQLTAYEYFCAQRKKSLVPILSRPLKYPTQRYVFDRLVARSEDTIFLENGAIRPEICFSSTKPMPQVEKGLVSFAAMQRMRERLSKLAQSASADATGAGRYYISRADGIVGRSQFFNLPEAEALFGRYGFESVVASTLSPEETLAKFSGCSVIAGIHGAGLMNGLMSSKPVRLIELTDFPSSWNSIHMIFSACGLRADRVAAFAPTAESSGMPLLDLKRIEALLQTLD